MKESRNAARRAVDLAAPVRETVREALDKEGLTLTLKADGWMAFRTFGCGRMGSLDELRGVMSAGETVSKLRSAPAPYLASGAAPKLGIGVDLNRCRDRVPALLGPCTCLTRTRVKLTSEPGQLGAETDPGRGLRYRTRRRS